MACVGKTPPFYVWDHLDDLRRIYTKEQIEKVVLSATPKQFISKNNIITGM